MKSSVGLFTANPPNQGTAANHHRERSESLVFHPLPSFLSTTTGCVRNVDVTHTLYTDPRQEGFQTYALKNSEYLIVLSSF